MTDSRPAFLFDVDGTLVDTNWLHTLAWWRALQAAGHDISMSRIHPLIGMVPTTCSPSCWARSPTA